MVTRKLFGELEMEKISKYSYSKKISISRNYGKIEEAIEIALEAKEE